MQTRKPIVAGQFYPAQNSECIEEINKYVLSYTGEEELGDCITGGIVPHAGWIFSGSIAAMTFSAIKEKHERVNTFVVFGAAHSYIQNKPAIFDSGSWRTPLGDIAIDEDLAATVLETKTAVSDPQAHATEHSIEVQIPFIQHLFPGAKILPIITPPSPDSIELGTAIGEIIKKLENKKVICIGSTDLTHYGPRYGFTLKGSGAEGIEWAKNVNDRQFIDTAVAMDAEKLLRTSITASNACGPGATAAVVQAAKVLGVTKGILLGHTTSYDVMLKKMAIESTESVGYASIVF